MWIGVLVGIVVALGYFYLYNGIVSLSQLTRNAWADVDVYLKRRSELIPNLVSAVKGYASHEQTVLTAVAEARAQATGLSGPTGAKAAAESKVGAALFNVVALAESYPELKAGENFQNLQKELSETERTIASARQYYNACVRDFNIKLQAFPTNIVASMMGLKQQEFFELDDVAERDAPSVA